MPKIPGGYYLKARIIQEKKISKNPPHVREIWDYLLMHANHKDKKYGGYDVKRGQLFRSYQEIREALCWYVGYRKMMYSMAQIKHAMKILRSTSRCVSTKLPRGSLISILNYDFYQNPKNYEATNETPNESSLGCPSINKNDKNKEKTFLSDSIEIRLSELLFNFIIKNNSKAKKPNLQGWAKDIDLMMRIDKRTSDDIEKVIRWCQVDTFWHANILSTAKLRKQFDQLSLKMKNNKPETPKEIIWGKAAMEWEGS